MASHGSASFASPAAVGGIVEFAVELALGAVDDTPGTAIWQPDANGALWDTKGVWSGLTPSWVDVTPRVMKSGTVRGRDRWEQQFRVGRSSVVVDNEDGIFNPDTVSDIGTISLRPGRWLRVLGRRIDDASPWVPLWTGQIDAMLDKYGPGAFGISNTIQSLDFGARFQIDDPPALDTPIPAGELTGDRVDRILTDTLWPTDPQWRDVDAGLNTMAESTLPQSRWAEMQVAAAAESGAMYMRADGVPAFRDKDWLPAIFAGPPKFTIGQAGSDVEILTTSTDWSQQRIYNDVRMARKGGTEYRVTDPDSRSLYGPRTYSRFDLQCETDGMVSEIADRFISTFRFDRARLEEVELVPVTAAGVTQLLNLELGDKVRIQVQTSGTDDWAYTSDYFVNRIEHDISSDDWVVTLRVDVAAFDSPLLQAAYTVAYSDAYNSEAP